MDEAQRRVEGLIADAQLPSFSLLLSSPSFLSYDELFELAVVSTLLARDSLLLTFQKIGINWRNISPSAAGSFPSPSSFSFVLCFEAKEFCKEISEEKAIDESELAAEKGVEKERERKKEFRWRVEVEVEIYAYFGSNPSERYPLFAGKWKKTITTQTHARPRKEVLSFSSFPILFLCLTNFFAILSLSPAPGGPASISIY